MSKKYLALLIVMIVLIILLISCSPAINQSNENKTTLTVSGESGYYSVSQIANDIETNSYYEGYNETTLKWFKTLDGVVVPANKAFVVMSKNDADSIPIESVTDVIIEDTISCNLIENRSLGNNLSDILVVKNVELISQEHTALWA